MPSASSPWTGRQRPCFSQGGRSHGHQPRRSRNSSAYFGAAILILIGVVALVANLGGPRIGEEAIPFAIGIALMVGYAFTRRYGYLVPGGILTGVGGGIWLASLLGVSDNGPYAVIGGGLGFLLIYALDVARTGLAAGWWPIVPGALMVVTGAGIVAQNPGVGAADRKLVAAAADRARHQAHRRAPPPAKPLKR